jgi:hypothetical protein
MWDLTSVLESVPADPCGLLSVVSLRGAKFSLVPVEIGTHFAKIGFFRDKSGSAIATTILSWVD